MFYYLNFDCWKLYPEFLDVTKAFDCLHYFSIPKCTLIVWYVRIIGTIYDTNKYMFQIFWTSRVFSQLTVFGHPITNGQWHRLMLTKAKREDRILMKVEDKIFFETCCMIELCNILKGSRDLCGRSQRGNKDHNSHRTGQGRSGNGRWDQGTGCSLNIVFFLKIFWIFWTLPVLLQRWCSTCLVCVHILTSRENRVRKIY